MNGLLCYARAETQMPSVACLSLQYGVYILFLTHWRRWHNRLMPRSLQTVECLRGMSDWKPSYRRLRVHRVEIQRETRSENMMSIRAIGHGRLHTRPRPRVRSSIPTARPIASASQYRQAITRPVSPPARSDTRLDSDCRHPAIGFDCAGKTKDRRLVHDEYTDFQSI
mmetsp:Transcript_42474/g.106016  ORF Transcript_42474/g.106016 Transcript_42474/m.106016 type:complete len:168 (-) Transcript_42474:298-801(-)